MLWNIYCWTSNFTVWMHKMDKATRLAWLTEASTNSQVLRLACRTVWKLRTKLMKLTVVTESRFLHLPESSAPTGSWWNDINRSSYFIKNYSMRLELEIIKTSPMFFCCFGSDLEVFWKFCSVFFCVWIINILFHSSLNFSCF